MSCIVNYNKLGKIVKIFPTPYELAEKFAEEMVNMIKESADQKKFFTIALSGGSTPELLFQILGEKYAETIPWQYVHFFWGDERCVPSGNIESNFGMAREKLLSKIEIPAINVHRIKGEDDPEGEARRYSEEIALFTLSREGIPSFDLILLGLGEDGHTVSIFPGHLDLFNSDKICEVATHPASQQKRITFTGRVLNNATAVTFLVSGEKKAAVVEKMFKNDPLALNYPASYVVPVHGSLTWLIDQRAGSLLL
jgi:6-phosphogluconolactonase